ncbi:MAG: hypothetical protein AB7V14_00920 [Kiritimatiellia bacterium]
MKKGYALLLIAGLFSSGCEVRSIYPWLPDESRVEAPSLLGAWHAAKGDTVAFFTGKPGEYEVMVANGGEAARFVATLHRIDDFPLLQVGPKPSNDLGSAALLPGYLLFKAEIDGDSLKLYEIDLESFPDRAAKSQIPLLPGGSQNDGYVLTGTAADSEAFLRSQLADPEFFDETPLYSFRRLSAEAP